MIFWSCQKLRVWSTEDKWARYYAMVCYSIENYSLLTHCSAMMLLVMDDRYWANEVFACLGRHRESDSCSGGARLSPVQVSRDHRDAETLIQWEKESGEREERQRERERKRWKDRLIGMESGKKEGEFEWASCREGLSVSIARTGCVSVYWEAWPHPCQFICLPPRPALRESQRASHANLNQTIKTLWPTSPKY